MELSKVFVCKLKATEEEEERLLTTLEAFQNACNYISKVAFERKVFNFSAGSPPAQAGG